MKMRENYREGVRVRERRGLIFGYFGLCHVRHARMDYTERKLTEENLWSDSKNLRRKKGEKY